MMVCVALALGFLGGSEPSEATPVQIAPPPILSLQAQKMRQFRAVRQQQRAVALQVQETEQDSKAREAATACRGALIVDAQTKSILVKSQKKLSPAAVERQWAKFLDELEVYDKKHGLDLPPPKR